MPKDYELYINMPMELILVYMVSLRLKMFSLFVKRLRPRLRLKNI